MLNNERQKRVKSIFKYLQEDEDSLPGSEASSAGASDEADSYLSEEEKEKEEQVGEPVLPRRGLIRRPKV